MKLCVNLSAKDLNTDLFICASIFTQPRVDNMAADIGLFDKLIDKALRRLNIFAK